MKLLSMRTCVYCAVACCAALALLGCSGQTLESDGGEFANRGPASQPATPQPAAAVGVRVSAAPAASSLAGAGAARTALGSLSHALSQAKDQTTVRFLTAIAGVYRDDPGLAAFKTRAAALFQHTEGLEDFVRPQLTLDAQTFDTPAALRLDQPLFDFGKKEARIERIKASILEQSVDLATEQQSLLRLALFAVLDYNSAVQRAEIYRRQIADLREARDVARELTNLNLLTEADIRLAEVELKQSEVRRLQAEQDTREARFQWNTVTDNATFPGVLQPMLLRRAAGVDTIANARRLSLSRNVALRSLEARTYIHRAEENLLQLRNTPTINATGLAQMDGSRVAVNLGITLTHEIYNRDRNDDLEELRARAPALRSEGLSIARDIRFELDRLQLVISSAAVLEKTQRDSLALLRQRVRDLDFQLTEGLVPYTEVISARQEVLNAELEILSNIYEARYAHASILLQSGALLQ